MRDLREVQLEAFHDELMKHGSKWYDKAGRSLANFGKRQLHGVTGWTPSTGIESIGAGAASARKALETAENSGAPADTLKRLTRARDANVAAQERGLTSIPGFVKGLVKKPGDTLRAGFEQQWHGTTLGDKALMLGLPAAGLAASAVLPDDPNNPHKGRDIGTGIAGTAASMFTGSLPLATGFAVGEGISRLGGAVGGQFDKRKKKLLPPPVAKLQAPPNPEEARGQHVPTERVMSPAAAGQMPEVG